MIELQSNITGIYRQTAKAVRPEHMGKVPDERKIMKEDKITIRADCRKIKEEEFARQVADRVRLSIRQEDAQKRNRMEKLADKLQNGSYQIDAARIADRMMIDERGWDNGEDKGAD